jgi:AsmA protein
MLIEQGGLRLAPLAGRVGSAAIEGEARVDSGSVRLAFDAPAIADGDLPALLGLLGAARPALLRLDQPAAASADVTIDRAASRLSGSGTLRVPAMALDPLRVQRLEAPFTIDGSRLAFTPTTFTINGGAHRGRVLLAFDAGPPRWSADSRVQRLDFGALLDSLAGEDAKIDGTGDLDADLRGRLVESFVSGIEGRARLVVSGGVLHDFPLVATINRALRLAEAGGSDTRFDRLSASLAIAGASAATDDLLMEAGHLRVELAGRIGFNRALALRGRAVVSKARAAEAVRSVRELARLRNSEGEVELPLTIGGTFDAPQFGLDLETAIKQGVRDELERRLRRLFRRQP